MSDVDVRALAGEELPAGDFPVAPKADFRLHIAPAVRQGIHQHAKQDASVEICGVLVGLWKRDADGPFADATDFIRCNAAESKFAEVTFTHESWAQINEQMDTAYAEKRILGWYHSHPDFGIFLSDRDVFIHEHFFSSPGQIAYVVDPVRELEGCFAWCGGKPTLLPHYWVGDKIVTSQHSARNERAEGASRAGKAAAAAAVAYAERVPDREDARFFGSTTTMLAGLSLFLLGYLLAGWRTRWEQSMVVEGAVAHYGQYKIARLGLRDHLLLVRDELHALRAALDKQPSPGEKLSEEAVQTAIKVQRSISDGLAVASESLRSISDLYSFTPQEEDVLVRFNAAKQAELHAPPKQSAPSPSQAQPESQHPDSEPTPPAPSAAGPSAADPAAPPPAATSPPQDEPAAEPSDQTSRAVRSNPVA